MKRRSGIGAVAAMALTCVFGTALLLSLAAGALVYRQVEERVEWSAEERVGLSYLSAKIRAYDESGMVRTGPFGGADALFLLEEFDGLTYETILYVYDGALRELFCEEGWEQDPESGQEIISAQALRVTRITPELLQLSYTGADGTVSTTEICLRSRAAA